MKLELGLWVGAGDFSTRRLCKLSSLFFSVRATVPGVSSNGLSCTFEIYYEDWQDGIVNSLIYMW